MRTALLMLLLALPCKAQDFWTSEKKLETTGLVAASILDGYTTQRLLKAGAPELNPIARPLVVQGVAGQTAACLLGVGAVVGLQYTLHRTRHYALERWVGRLALLAESANDVRQVYKVRRISNATK